MDLEQIEKEARTMGWRPQEEYKGDPDKWVPAEEFVERGQHVMPILRENNKRLQKELEKTSGKLGTLESQLQEAQTVISTLKKHYDEASVRAVEQAKRELREELKTARDSGDVDAEFKILDKLGELRDAERQAEKNKETPTKKSDSPEDKKGDPDLQSWYKERPWFGGTSKEDRRLTKAITRIAEDLREEGTDLTGVEFLNECQRLLDEQEGNNGEEEEEAPTPRRPSSKVEGTPARGNANGRGAKSFANLPRDAQQACLDDAERLVGKGKAYATLEDWKKAYAKTYYEED